MPFPEVFKRFYQQQPLADKAPRIPFFADYLNNMMKAI